MEDDQLGAAGGRDAGAVVEHSRPPTVHFLPRLEVAHEAGDRRVHGQRDVVLARASSPSRSANA